MSGATSRSRSQAILQHWRDNVFGFEGPMLQWFDGQGFSMIQEFGMLEEEDINEMEYLDSTVVPKSHRVRFKAAIGYFHYISYLKHKDGSLDIVTDLTINRETFDKFLALQFDPRRRITRYDVYSIEYCKQVDSFRERYEKLKVRSTIKDCEKMGDGGTFRYSPFSRNLIFDI